MKPQQASRQAAIEAAIPAELMTAPLNLPGGKLLKPAAQLIEKGVQKILPITKPVTDRIYSLYNSAIGGARGKNIGDLGNIKSSRVGAMQAIHENLKDIKLQNPQTGKMESRTPQNRLDLARAFDQTKKLIWKKVSDLSQGATERGAVINIRNIAEQAKKETLEDWGKEAVNTTRRSEAKYLDDIVPMYGERGTPKVFPFRHEWNPCRCKGC